MKSKLSLCLIFLISACYPQQYKEKFRPQFHFTPQEHWMNDPNGMVFLNGKYHLFYQYHPNSSIWGPMHWGHATSTDLLTWKELPIALYPDDLGWIFSGSCIIDKYNTAGFGANAMIAIFTYHNNEIEKAGKIDIESQGIAYSIDEGVTWKKYDQNPVLKNTGDKDFRDPKVFWYEKTNKWIMTLAVGKKINFYSSNNLKKWDYESSFTSPNDGNDLGVWECPDLFTMKTDDGEEKFVLIVNHGDKAPNGGSGSRYFIGDFDGKSFVSSQKSIWFDYGTDFYAAVTFSNLENNKNILLAWMSNWQYATKVPTEKWRSAMTLPRELSLIMDKSNFKIYQKIVKSFDSSTKTIYTKKNVATPFLKKIDLSQTEILIDLPSKLNDLTIDLMNDKGEVFSINYDSNSFTTNRMNSGITDFNENFAKKIQEINLNQTKITSIQLVMDKSSVEIILNKGEYSMTNLFFPNEEYSNLSIKTKNKSKLKTLKISTIKGIWN